MGCGLSFDFCMVASSDSSRLVSVCKIWRSETASGISGAFCLLSPMAFILLSEVSNSSANSMSTASLRAAAKSAGLLQSNN